MSNYKLDLEKRVYELWLNHSANIRNFLQHISIASTAIERLTAQGKFVPLPGSKAASDVNGWASEVDPIGDIRRAVQNIEDELERFRINCLALCAAESSVPHQTSCEALHTS